MSHSQEPVGEIMGIPLSAASGLHLDMTEFGAVTFVSFLDAGTQNVALKESTGSGTTEQALAVIDKIYKSPGTGGTVTKVTQTAAATFDLTTDATNDQFWFTVYATDMTALFTHLEVTASAGTLLAFQHAPRSKRDATLLPTQIG